MLKKTGFWLVLVVGIAALNGCSTAPRRQESRPVQQAPVVVSQNDAEMERMKQDLNDQQAALARSEAEKKELEDKLSDALASKKTTSKKSEDSYLK